MFTRLDSGMGILISDFVGCAYEHILSKSVYAWPEVNET